jgi:hypothetical protein
VERGKREERRLDTGERGDRREKRGKGGEREWKVGRGEGSRVRGWREETGGIGRRGKRG